MGLEERDRVSMCECVCVCVSVCVCVRARARACVHTYGRAVTRCLIVWVDG